MNNRFFKFNMFLAVGMGLSLTLFLLEIENDNSFLLAQEHGKSINSLNNKNLQSSSTINSYTDNFNKQISIDEENESRTINNHNDYNSE
jgi:hypothetical protein